MLATLLPDTWLIFVDLAKKAVSVFSNYDLFGLRIYSLIHYEERIYSRIYSRKG